MAGLFGNWFNQTFNQGNQLGDFLTGLTRNIFGIQPPQNVRPNWTPQQQAPSPSYPSPQQAPGSIPPGALPFPSAKAGWGNTYSPQLYGTPQPYGGMTPQQQEEARQNAWTMGNAPHPLLNPATAMHPAKLDVELANQTGPVMAGFGYAPPHVNPRGWEPLVPIRTPQLTPQQAAILSSGLGAELLREKLNMARKKK